MSRKDEIIEVLKNHQKTGTLGTPLITCGEYNSIATEIEKLYEGKVEYVLQKQSASCEWSDIVKGDDKDVVFDYMTRAKEMSPEYKFRIVKRTTTDQIIEE